MSITDFQSLYNFPNLYANGCQVVTGTSTTFLIAPGLVRDSTNSIDIQVKDPIFIDTSVVGVNGLDTGTLQNNSTYFVYVLSDVSGVNKPCGIISLSGTAPTLPTVDGVSYSAMRMIDFVSLDNSSAIIPTVTTGNGNVRYKRPLSQFHVLANGTSTSYANIPLGKIIPNSNVMNIQFFDALFSTVGSNKLYVKGVSDPDVTFYGYSLSNSITSSTFWLPPENVSSVPSIQYKVDSPAQTEIFVLGYNFFI